MKSTTVFAAIALGAIATKTTSTAIDTDHTRLQLTHWIEDDFFYIQGDMRDLKKVTGSKIMSQRWNLYPGEITNENADEDTAWMDGYISVHDGVNLMPAPVCQREGD